MLEAAASAYSGLAKALLFKKAVGEMDGYLSIREAAKKWGVSERRINQYCADERIPGALKFGKAWAIPVDAKKPGDPRRARLAEKPAPVEAPFEGPLDHANLMPLMNTPFAPGHCQEAVDAMAAGPQRDIAFAEYCYFSGRPKEAAEAASAYLASPDIVARLSACWIYAYANLPLGQTSQARCALEELSASLSATEGSSPQLRATSAFFASVGSVLLHLPLPEEVPEAEAYLPLLPLGLRAFAL